MAGTENCFAAGIFIGQLKFICVVYSVLRGADFQ